MPGHLPTVVGLGLNLRGRILDLPVHHLDVYSNALALVPVGDLPVALQRARARRSVVDAVTAEHFHLTPADMSGICRSKEC